MFFFLFLTSGDESKKQQGQPPKFITKPMIRQEGDKIIFDCKLTADPKPTITWYKGTEVLKAGGRYKMNMTSDKANHTISMEIAGGGMQDGGEYKAVAKNNFGESTATITLNFEGLWIFTGSYISGYACIYMKVLQVITHKFLYLIIFKM